MINRTILGYSLAALGVVAFFVWYFSEEAPERRRRSAPARTPTAATGKAPTTMQTGYLTDLLCKEHWTPTAASNIERLLHECWSNAVEEWANQYPTALPMLQNLGKHPELMALLERRPECVFLLADADRPDRIGKLLGPLDDRQYRIVEGWLKQNAARADSELLLDALEHHLPLMVQLSENHLIGVERILMFPRNDDAEQEYDRWLTDVIQGDILPGEILVEQRSSLLNFLISQGPLIRVRMQKDAAFRRNFRDKLWPKFVKLAAPDLWDAYAAMPGVWKILEESDGYDLMKKYYQLPVLLLASPEAYPADLHEFVFQTLRLENWELLAALERCRNEYQFKEFIRKKGITDLAFRNIIRKLLACSPEPAADADDAALERLEQKAAEDRKKILDQVLGWINQKNFTAIEEEYGNLKDAFILRQIPGYDAYKLVDKLVDGRHVTVGEVAGAVQDVLTLGSFVPGTGAVKPASSSSSANVAEIWLGIVSREGREAGKETASQTVERFARKLLRNPNSEMTRSVVVGNALRTLQKPLRELKSHPQGLDVTSVLRLMSKQSETGFHSFQHLANWEARLVIRDGGRVFVSIDSSKIPDWAGSRLKEHLSKESVSAAFPDDPEKLEQAWRRNCFAWWAMQFAQRK